MTRIIASECVRWVKDKHGYQLRHEIEPLSSEEGWFWSKVRDTKEIKSQMKASFRPVETFSHIQMHTHTHILHSHGYHPIQFSLSCSRWISIDIIHFYSFILSLSLGCSLSLIIIHETEAFLAPHRVTFTHTHAHIPPNISLRQQKRPNDGRKQRQNKALNRAAGAISSQKHYSVCRNLPLLCCVVVVVCVCTCLRKVTLCSAW